MKLLLIFFLLLSFSFSREFPKELITPGGIITHNIYAKTKPRAFHGERELLVIKGNKKDEYKVFAGVGLNQKVGSSFDITIKVEEEAQEAKSEIQHREYQKQYIKLKTNKHVNLSKKNLDRHYEEKKLVAKVKDSFTKQKFRTLNMLKPVDAKFSNDFGKRRYFNGKPRKPHSGIDLAAPIGTEIRSPLKGEVVIAQNFFFSGNVVYIDHGLGLLTMYAHLDKIDVKVGDRVKKGELIGKVGKTGRVTGPHLHWGVMLNGSMVDPLLFF